MNCLVAMVLSLLLYTQVPQPSARDDLITIRFRVFDADDPTGAPLKPAWAEVWVREPGTTGEAFQRKVDFSGPEADGLYALRLDRRKLFPRILIYSGRDGVRYNTAVISKAVTANDMVIYVGASDPNGRFSFKSFEAQMAQYRSLFDDLIDQYGVEAEPQVRTALMSKFGREATQTAFAYSSGRIEYSRNPLVAQAQAKRAEALANEIICVYSTLHYNLEDSPFLRNHGIDPAVRDVPWNVPAGVPVLVPVPRGQDFP